MAVNDNPAQGGTIYSSSGSATDNTTTNGNGGGVQLTNVNNANDSTRTSIVGVTINNTSGAPTANALDIESSNPGGSAAIFNGAYNIPFGTTPGPGTTFPTATNSLTTTVSGGAAFNEFSNANAGNQLYGTNNFTGSYGVTLSAPGGFVNWNLNGNGTENFVANGTAVAGIYATAGSSFVNVAATQGTINISGFATGLSLSGNGVSVDTTGGGIISGVTTGMNVDGRSGTTTVSSGSAITDTGAGIRASTSAGGGVSVTTTSIGTIDGGTVGIVASGATGTNTTTVVVGAAIGGTTAPTTAGVQASTTGSGTVGVTANAAISAAGTGSTGIALAGNGAGNNVTVASGVTVQGAVGLDVGGGTTTLSNSGTIASTTGGNAIQIDSGTLNIGNNAGTINGAIADAGALAFTNTAAIGITSAITGAGTVTQAGTGVTTLGGTNAYMGGTTLAAGTLAVSADANLGGAGGGLTFTGGTLDATSGFSSARAVTLNTAGTVQVDAGTLALSGVVADGSGGAGSLTKTGAGTLTLTGTESYTGGTTISGGTLQVGDGTVVGSGASLGTGAVTDNAALVLNRAGTTTFANAVSGTGSLTVKGVGNGNTETLSGTLTQTGGFTVADASTVTLTGSYGSTATPGASLSLNGGTFTNAGSIYGANSIQGVVENVAGTFVNQNGAIVSGGNNAISIAATTGTAVVDNAGTLIGRAFDGVAKANANSTLNVTNRSTGVIVAQGSSGANGYGVFSRAGTVNVTNTGGKIVGLNDGVALLNSATGTIVNAGTIASGSYDTGTGAITVGGVNGVLLQAGGTVTNLAGGLIEGATHGLESDANALNLNNYGSVTGGQGGILAVGSGAVTANLYAGSTTGNIALSGGGDTVSLYTGTGMNGTGVVQNGTVLQRAGVNAAAITGTIALGAGANALNLRGTGDGGTNNGAIGTVDLHGVTGATTINKFDTGTFQLTESAAGAGSAGATINAGNGGMPGSGGLLQFNGTGDLTGAINVNGTKIQALTAGAFGSGTINATDPTIEYSASGTYANAINLASTDPVNDPVRLEVDSPYTATLSGAITQSGTAAQNVVFDGGGTAILNNANNSWTGTTTVSKASTLNIDSFAEVGTGGLVLGDATTAGTLGLTNGAALSNGQAVQLGAGGGTISTANAALTLTGPIADVGGQAGALTKSGAGTLVLTGTNTYTGGTTLAAGTLAVSADANLGGAAGGLTFTGGTLDATSGFSSARAVTLNTAGTVQVDAGTLALSGTVADGTSGAGSLTKTGTGTLSLSGTNTYTGGTTLNAGTLAASTDANLGGATGGLTFTGGTLDATSGFSSARAVTLNTAGTVQVDAGPLTLSGAVTDGTAGAGSLTKTGTGTLTLSGTNTYTGATLVSAGTLGAGSISAFGTNSAVTDNATLDLDGFNETIGSLAGTGTVTNSGGTTGTTAATLTTGTLNTDTTFSGTIQDGTATTALTKVGSGTLTLSGNNGFTGGLAVTAGRVVESDTGNALGLGTVAIGTGATVELAASGSNGYTQAPNTFTGAGTLVKTGTGALTFGGNGGNTYISLSQGGLIDVQGGTLGGSSSGQGIWTSNQASLNVAAGAVLNTVEAAVFVDALTGSGLYTGGYAGTRITTIGVAGGSGTFSGTLQDNTGSGALAIVKTGLGTETLTGTNTYTGGTTISGGTLQIGDGTTSGSIVGDVVDNATLAFDPGTANGSFAGNVSGSGAVVKTGGNTETLTGNNTYTGATTVNGGTLMAGSATAFGTDSAVTVTAASPATSATLDLAGFDETIGSLNGTGTVTNSSATTAATLTTGTLGVDAAFSGNIANGAGTLALTKTGAGTLTLSGANTYTGATTVNGGTLKAGSATAFGTDSAVTDNATLDLAGFNETIGSLNGTGTVTNSSATTAATLTTGTLGANAAFSGNIVNGAGTLALTKTGAGTLTLTGTDTYTGGTTISGGTLQIGDGTTSGSIVGDVVDNATLAFDPGTANGSFAGNVSGTGAVVKIGGNTETLTGTNTYTGGTTISGGTLQIGAGGTTGSVIGAIVDNGALVINENANVSLGAISGSGSLSVLSAGGSSNVFLTGAASYTGATAIAANSTLYVGTGGSLTGTSGIADNGTFTTAASSNITVSAPITGTGQVQQQGPGTTVLSGTNTYSGGTSINGGTLKAGSNSAFGSGSVNFVPVVGNATLDLGGFSETVGVLSNAASQTFTSTVTNSGAAAATLSVGTGGGSGTFSGTIQDGTATTALTKTGAGTETLSGTNTYTGGTTLAAGTLAVSADANLGSAAGGLAFTGGTLDATSGFASTRAVTLTGAGRVQVDAGTLALSGTIANGLGATGTLTKTGTGILSLSAAESYTGATTITAGTLALTGAGSLAASSGIADNAVFDISGTANGASVTTLSGTTAGATVTLGARTLTVTNGSSTFAGAINGTGGLSITGGTETLTGSNGYTGATSIASGSRLRVGGGILSPAGSIAGTSGIVDNGTLEFSNGTYGMTSQTVGQVISGSGALIQDGYNNTLVLTAADTYAGATTIASNSTLQLGDGGTTGSILATSSIVDNGTLSFDRSDAVTFAQVVTGSGGLSQIGSGTLTLTAAQTYTGATSIAANTTLQLGDGGTTGSIANTSGIADAGTLAVNQSGTLTLGRVISGGGTLTVAGGGTTVLNAANTYTGGTTIGTGSTLEIGAQGSAGTGAITYGSGQELLRIDATATNGATFADTLADFAIGDTLDLAGLTFAADATAVLSNGTLTVTSGGVSENFTLSNPGTSGFATALDAQGGTLITAYAAPVITGTVAGQTTTSEAPVTPFSGVTVTDPNPGTDTLTIALSGGGGTLAGAGTVNPDGTYTLTGSAAAITAQLDAVTFTPTAGRANTRTATSFTLTDVSSLTPAATATDGTTTVTNTDPAVAPVIAGTRGGQTTAAEAPVMPFASATVMDANAGASDSLTISLSGGGGLLSGAGLSRNPDGSYSFAATDPATLTAELKALSFTPTKGAPGSATTTLFTLTDRSSAGTVASDVNTSVTDTAAPAPPPAPAPTPVVPGSVSIGSQVSFSDGVFTLSGTASSAAGVAGVEISAVLNDGSRQDLGAATLNGDGTFAFADRIGADQQGFIQATLTDGAGVRTTSADPGFSLTGGLDQHGFVARQMTYADGGNAGSAVSLFRSDGSRQVNVQQGGQTFTSGFFDTFLNHGAPNNTFVFDAGHGLDVVSQFRVRGADHDTLSFKGADFGNDISAVLQNAHNARGGVVILDPTTGDTVKLVGVNKHQLALNRGDIAFHG